MKTKIKTGQDVSLEYRRHANHSGQALPDTVCLLSFCYHFAIDLLPNSPSGLPFATVLLPFCYPFATPIFLYAITKAR